MFPLLLIGACLLGPVGSVTGRSLGHRLVSGTAREEPEEGEVRKHEAFYKWMNFLLLAGALTFLLRKPLGEFFTQRSASIRKSLDEGREALEASQAQLTAVEEKLRHLDEEIAAFKASAVREMEAERQRLRQATEEEADKILESARAQIEALTRAAKLELRIYAARQALELAEEMIRQSLDDASRKRLVSRFVDELTVDSQKK